MSGKAFHRTADVVKTHSEGLGASPPPRSAAAEIIRGHGTTSTASSAQEAMELDGIRRELDELRHRRAVLEAHRQRLLEESRASRQIAPSTGCASRTLSPSHCTPQPVWSTSGLTSTHNISEPGSAAASHSPGRQRYVDSTVLANMSVIPSEESRRRQLRPTPQLSVKSAMRAAAAHDSTLLMGGFLLEDNPQTCTFGRERRFRSVVGQRGKYYLSTEVALEQLLNRGDLDPAAQQRLMQRCEQTPGPGAYTPRYSKVSRPPRQY